MVTMKDSIDLYQLPDPDKLPPPRTQVVAERADSVVVGGIRETAPVRLGAKLLEEGGGRLDVGGDLHRVLTGVEKRPRRQSRPPGWESRGKVRWTPL